MLNLKVHGAMSDTYVDDEDDGGQRVVKTIEVLVKVAGDHYKIAFQRDGQEPWYIETDLGGIQNLTTGEQMVRADEFAELLEVETGAKIVRGNPNEMHGLYQKIPTAISRLFKVQTLFDEHMKTNA